MVAELALKMETAKLEMEVAVNQREAIKENLSKEAAHLQQELARAKAERDGLEEELSRTKKVADEKATLLEKATSQSVLDKEEIRVLQARVLELGDSLLQEKAIHEVTRQEKVEADDLVEVTFDEAIYMAWCKDKNMNLLVFPDPDSKRAEYEAKEREDADLRADAM